MDILLRPFEVAGDFVSRFPSGAFWVDEEVSNA